MLTASRNDDHVTSSDYLELQELAARYWARADGATEYAIKDLFTEDAVLTLGSLTLTGVRAIEEFFRERDETQRAAQRTTRHFACNFLVTPIKDKKVLVRSTALVYSGTGSLPLPLRAPSGIADFEDVCRVGASGLWMFERRIGRTVFVGEGAPSFAR